MTIVETGRALRERRFSVCELTKDTLDRIAQANPRLNAFITVTEESALARARELDEDFARGVDHGPLHGVPVAHKDAFYTKGVRTTAGTRILADFIPDQDADVVAKLRAAGTVMVGKANLHELCHGITSDNPHYGSVRNPWDIERIPGGSSGGSSALLAADLVPLATGTDTGGSIRIPAAYCGVVGLKPTYDRWSRRGVVPLAFSLDHVGPMTQTVRDAALAFGATAPENPEIKGLRIGVPENFFFDRLDPEVAAGVRRSVQVVAGLGAVASEVRVPDPDALNTVGRLIQLAEASTIWRRYRDRRADFGADVYALLQQGLLLPATDYIDAQRVRKMLAGDFARIWTSLDCLIAPVTAIPAPRIGEMTVQVNGSTEDVRLASTRLTRPFNVLGWPALALPCGLSKAGLPIGLQLVAPPNREDTLIRVGAALEDALAVQRHPRDRG
ncbi:MAG TPA: amidase [Bryobacteraceae bacterium]|jgi:aspartyl-tRNA(Asn)/glutamyl-tRNA(Gln) amidotransferase subunit A